MSSPYYPPNSCTSNPNQELAEEIIQTTSGALSVFGSFRIIYDVLSQHYASKRSSNNKITTDPYQRIMLGLSFFDLSHSFFDSFMGTWMTPRETGWLMAAGNQATCTAQGFFTALGFMGCLGYHMALSINILLLITFNWSQRKFARTIEKPIHSTILVAAFVYAAIPLPLESYNPDCGQCLWAPLYGPCRHSTNDFDRDYRHNLHPLNAEIKHSNNLCVIRGSTRIQNQYWEVFWAFLWITLIICTSSMVTVYITVRRQERRMERYAFTPSNPAITSPTPARNSATTSHNSQSRRIRKILFLYTFALYFCWGIPFTIIFISTELEAWPSQIPFVIRAVLETLIPLCGFCNMLVYFMPKSLNRQKNHPGSWLMNCYFHVIFGSSLCKICSFFRKFRRHSWLEQGDIDYDLLLVEEQDAYDVEDETLRNEFEVNFADFNATVINRPTAIDDAPRTSDSIDQR